MSGDRQLTWLPSFGHRRHFVGVLGLLLVLALLAGCAAPASAPVQPAAQVPTAAAAQVATAPVATAPAAATGVMIALGKNDTLGTFLVDEKGNTLYLFTKDTANTSTCYDQCEANWPGLMTTGAPRGGDGVNVSLLGTTTRKDGKTQVTYNGHPVYYFAKDEKPGDVNGQEIGGVWYVVSPKGEEIESPEAAATPTAQAGAEAKTVEVTIRNFSFGAPLTVPAGTTVTWTNDDTTQHTVTATNGDFDSGKVAPGESFSFTFTKEGTYDYACLIHSSMTGQVVVTK